MEEGKLGRVVRKISGTDKYVPVRIFEATVISVDESKRTCIVNSERDNVDGITVNLMASVDDGHFQVPTVGATVIIIYNEIVGALLAQHSSIDKHLLIAGNQSYQNDGTTQKFNDGAFGGLIKIEELVSKINTIESRFNSFLSSYNTHLHSGGTISGNTAVPSVIYTNTLSTTNRDDIENKSITHGNSL